MQLMRMSMHTDVFCDCGNLLVAEEDDLTETTVFKLVCKDCGTVGAAIVVRPILVKFVPPQKEE